ncbi:hypothetical protein GS399_17195 [Pedobacter sp. HMF7647]|uniref:Lipoprotein n=1 Tax=Hufsiella arboris TaxID=2695275 RepID=A0A7K1YDQ4_9SPHI|nr:hypothetical protein [Hufsiella arboris]MXV52712.1 hypothetical protein [Hufsiella arboris]
MMIKTIGRLLVFLFFVFALTACKKDNKDQPRKKLYDPQPTKTYFFKYRLEKRDSVVLWQQDSAINYPNWFYISQADISVAGVSFADRTTHGLAWSQFLMNSITPGDYTVDERSWYFFLHTEKSGVESQIVYWVGPDTPGASITIHITKSNSDIVEGSFFGRTFKLVYQDTDKKLYDIEGSFRLKRHDKTII